MVRFPLAGCVVAISTAARPATLTWTGDVTNLLWTTAANWQPAGLPGSDDTALFDQAGSSHFPGDVTSKLFDDHVVESLRIRGSGTYHGVDLEGNALQVLRTLDVNFDALTDTIATIEDGALQIGSADEEGNVSVATRVSAGVVFSATLDLSRLSLFAANLDAMQIGVAANGASVGTIKLADTNDVVANSILVGRANISTKSTGASTLLLGDDNAITADELIVGDRFANGLVKGLSGGSFQLGTVDRPTRLLVGRLDAETADDYSGEVDLMGMAFHGLLNDLVVGDRSLGGAGALSGKLRGGMGGDIAIGAGDPSSDFVVGRVVQGGVASALVDLSGMDSLTATVNQMVVGAAGGGGVVEAVVMLPHDNVITAQRISVGAGENARGELHFGSINTILSADVVVGSLTATRSSDVVVPAGGQLLLGSAESPATLTIGQGFFDLTAASLSGNLRNLAVGDNARNGPKLVSSLGGATGGAIQVGTPTQPGNIVVGRNRSEATLDLSGLDSLDANLDELLVGVAPIGIPVRGTVEFPASSTISASRIVIGQSGDQNQSLLRLGSATLLAGEILVGMDESKGRIEVRAGASLAIGSAERPTRLVVGRGDTDTNSSYAGTLDVAGSQFDAWLSDLIVGQKNDLSGVHTGAVMGGNSGQVFIGNPELRGTIAIGNSRAVGSVDFASMNRLSAYVDQMLIGVANGRRAEGSFALPEASLIDAHSIVIGSDPSSPTSHGQDGQTIGALTLGRDTTILADEIVVGRDYGNGVVRASLGSHVQIGLPQRRANLSLGTAITNTNETYFGHIDLSGATVTAWLGNVVLGDKNMLPGFEQAELLFSNEAGNMIDADAIMIGGNRSLGLLRFAGGVLRADSITRGTGDAVFDWTGGTLQVANFGRIEAPFDLKNQSGVLVPDGPIGGPSIGVTNVFGDYVQGEVASLEIEIGGSALGFDADQLVISGTAALGGTLKVAQADDGPFDPIVGQSFDILTSTHGVMGAFNDVELPDLLSGLAWRVNYLPNSVNLEIIEGLSAIPADFNDDGAVDGRDLLAWQRGESPQPGTSLDFNTWQANFGATDVAGVGSATVPEPAGGLLGLLVAVAASLGRKGRLDGDEASAKGAPSPASTVRFFEFALAIFAAALRMILQPNVREELR